MKRLIILLVLFSVNILATNTEGILTFDEKNLNVGGIYKFNLILVPYEYKEIDNFKDMAEKKFLDFFYINEIENVRRSENNSDAIIISGSLVVLKKVGKKPFYIANHRDLNFPVRIGDIKTFADLMATGNKENFFPVGKIEEAKRGYKWWWLLVIALIVIALALRKVISNKDHVVIAQYDLKKLSSLEEAVILYENKRVLVENYPDHLESLKDIIKDVENIIFAPKDTVSNYDLVNQKIEIMLRSNDGA